jgi:hypothetical protein
MCNRLDNDKSDGKDDADDDSNDDSGDDSGVDSDDDTSWTLVSQNPMGGRGTEIGNRYLSTNYVVRY